MDASTTISVYRTSGKEFDAFHSLVYELSKNSKAIIAGLHDLQFFDRKIGDFSRKRELFNQVFEGMFVPLSVALTMIPVVAVTWAMLNEKYPAPAVVNIILLIIAGVISMFPSLLISGAISAGVAFSVQHSHNLVSRAKIALLSNLWRDRA